MQNFQPLRAACLCLAALLSLSACTGSNLSVGGKTVVLQSDHDVPIDHLVAVYPITPALIENTRAPQVYSSRNPALEQQRANYRYRIGSGDVLNIMVWDFPQAGGLQSNATSALGNTGRQVSNGTWVDETGHIFYPLAGKMHVRGKTLAEVQSLLTQRLRRYIRHPQVDVNIAEFRSQHATVSGAVNKPGQFPLTNVPMTLLDAVNLAGGFSESANTSAIKWTHQGVDHTVALSDIVRNGALHQNRLLGNGDIIYVPPVTDTPVHIMGEVGKQQTLSMGTNGLSLTEALGKAEGLNQTTARPTGVFVIRKQDTETENGVKPIAVYQLNLSDASALALGTQFKLQPNDVVYVTAAPISRWHRVMGQVMPSIANAISIGNIFR